MHVAAIKPPKASTYEPAENSKGADALAKMAKLQTLRGTLSRLDPATNGPPVLNDTAATETQLDDFPAGWLHELWAPKAHDHTSAAAWALSALTVHDKPLLWITNHTLLREQGVPYGPGLMAAGLTPADFILVRARNQEDSLWALEEAIKSDAFRNGAVDVKHLYHTISRRDTVDGSRERVLSASLYTGGKPGF